MQTGENEQALRKIIEFTRLLAIVVLCLHFYFSCYGLFKTLHLSYPLVNSVLVNLNRLVIFRTYLISKSVVLLLLLVSLVGTKGKKTEKFTVKNGILLAAAGLLFFFSSGIIFLFKGAYPVAALAYMAITMLGFGLFITGTSRLFRIMNISLKQDIFNEQNETFPQEERKLENEFSFNLPAAYNLKGKTRLSWINIINPFRSTLILGSPGAGKTYFVIRHIITQSILKGYTAFIYDWKYDDLTRIAYNTLRNHHKQYKVKPKFYVINFEDLSHSHRCNPLDPANMLDITDAMESSRTFMLGLNREWIKKSGDFFVESPINFVTALIWFLRKYKDGLYCTLPHVIELAQLEYKYLFALLKTEPEIEVLINPFISAWQNEAYDQLEGQIASAKISMARLVSPALYYVLSGNDFTLDLNKPDDPKIICMGNNPLKQQVYGAVLSLYISRTIKLVNQKGKLKCNLIFDEFPTIYFNNIDHLIATARSNKVATTLAVQDYSQLKKDYGREQAEVIMNIVGNILAGQVTGDTAKQLTERFGKIMQERQSITVTSQDTSVSKSSQLDFAIPASKIATLSSGEFVGMVADEPGNKISLKVFHNEIINDHAALVDEEKAYLPLPIVRTIDKDIVMANYLNIKRDIQEMVMQELDMIRHQP